MSGTRALLAAILFSCAAMAAGGAFAWRALRAEKGRRAQLLGRYGAEFALLEELSTKVSRGAGALSREDYSTGSRALARPGILVARIRSRRSPSTLRIDRRLSLQGSLLDPAGRGVRVRSVALPLRAGGSVDAVVAVWKVRAGPDCEEVVCEFAVDAGALKGR